MLKDGLAPCIRTAYSRTAFQLASTNAVRISLDTNLVFSNEVSTDDGLWCSRPEKLKADDVLPFPYAVLEIKLQEGSPDWVDHIVQQPYVIQVKKFSVCPPTIIFRLAVFIPARFILSRFVI